MTQRERFKMQEQRLQLLIERGSRCEVCGNHLTISNLQIAHRIPQSKANLKKYGKKIIHHPLNLATVCSLKCNSAVLCNPATMPITTQKLIKKIEENLNEDR